MPRHKTVKTLKEYRVYKFNHDFTVPAGSTVSNKTAMGPDDDYRFWSDYETYLDTLPKLRANVLRHELVHRGINVPPELCEPYSR